MLALPAQHILPGMAWGKLGKTLHDRQTDTSPRRVLSDRDQAEVSQPAAMSAVPQAADAANTS